MSGANSIPRLVVKIIGGKQVKRFIEEPREDSGEKSKSEEKQEVKVSRSDTQLQPRAHSALKQLPDRTCVTAPSGDRSRSYIHPRTVPVSDPRAAEQEGASEDGDKAALVSAVREELSDWRLSALRSTEDEVAALDPSFGGTLDRSEITRLFLENDVPLKLPTFSLLLQMFTDRNDPVQIHYRDLLRFMKRSAFPEELRSDSELQELNQDEASAI